MCDFIHSFIHLLNRHLLNMSTCFFCQALYKLNKIGKSLPLKGSKSSGGDKIFVNIHTHKYNVVALKIRMNGIL